VVAVEAGRLAGPMTEFMKCGPVPIDRLEIGSRRPASSSAMILSVISV
jgi:hypothetical protein